MVGKIYIVQKGALIERGQMNRQIKIRVEIVTFSVFVLFLLMIGLGLNNGITGFSVKDLDDELWIVEFDSVEMSDLSIEMINGRGYSSNGDVEFVGILCGDSPVIPNILTNEIIYNGYKCKEKTKIMFTVNNEGRFKQKITIGEEVRIVSFKK